MASAPDIDKLRECFVGQRVAVTHTDNPNLKDASGVCTEVFLVNAGMVEFRVGSNAYTLKPTAINPVSVVGTMHLIKGQRKISLVT